MRTLHASCFECALRLRQQAIDQRFCGGVGPLIHRDFQEIRTAFTRARLEKGVLARSEAAKSFCAEYVKRFAQEEQVGPQKTANDDDMEESDGFLSSSEDEEEEPPTTGIAEIS